jgi:uncharacterized membrane protein
MRKVLWKIIITTLILLYPYLVYKGIQQGLVWFAPSVIASLYFVQAIKAKTIQIRSQKIVIVLLLIVGTVYYQNLMAKLIPVFIQLNLMLFFGKTLLIGKGPSVIERFAKLSFPQIPPLLSQYCRYLTLIWTIFFAINALTCVVLALYAPVEWWMLYTGVIILMLTGLLIVVEYIWRHFYFRTVSLPEKLIPNVKESIKSMAINGRKIWEDVNAS